MVDTADAAIKFSVFSILIAVIKAGKRVDIFKGNNPLTIFVPGGHIMSINSKIVA
ncbi:MAG: hypothetical protein HWQ43_21840 [Nostoc sp. JL31]|uniref:hypothetical protein n=1 Tax=Nostoc sp. JL31 TaxID=2815395 RepID=UPI0025F1A97D|nr:hypothetical protein [Nostoc sp. JL31]MBN3891682.1 hypothetical protein [Nostoc sp. JL31]